MAKKSKKTIQRPAKTVKKAATPTKKAAAKSVKKAPTKATRATATKKSVPKAKAAAVKSAAKAKGTPKAARLALTPSKPTTPARKPAMAAKTAEATPVAAKPAPHVSAKTTLTAPDDLTIDRPHYGQLSEDDLRKVKTGLSKKDLEHFREILLEKRAEIVGDVEGLEHHRTAGAGEMSHMPLHPADVGSDHYEQEFNLGLMQSEKRLLREIDEALLRIQSGTYGVCFESGRPIPRARLEIKPWAKYTIEVAMEREKRGLH